ncbi:MAG TPA: nuclear transport factor 2 family protein [Verrucomicrobiales bacterium]|nr:nuclear transport factor 2 family protein [Verrucomicrobiales bacterium]
MNNPNNGGLDPRKGTMNRTARILIVGLCLAGRTALGQDPPAEDPGHEELRILRAQIIEAIQSGDVERVLPFVHSNVVITWQNNEVCRGHAGLLEFFNRMGKKAFQEYKMPPAPDELTMLYGDDAGVSFGRTVASYRLLGKDLELESRWTATLVKEQGQWLLAGYHISMNVLDNPLLNGAKQSAYLAGGGALAAGLVIGLLLGRRRRAT